MEILSFSEREFKKLKKYELPRNVESTECELFIFDKKDKWNYNKTLLKKFFVTSGEYFSDKLYTINMLADTRLLSEIDELVLPQNLFALDGKIQGFTMSFIEKNVNLKIILNSEMTSLFKKVKILQKIGYLLEKIARIEELKGNFFLGDIHEGNFIYDINKNMYRVVDLDSAKIGNNNPSVSKYLTTNDKLRNFSNKYPLGVNGCYINNEETTLLSYIYMILNTISRINISRLTIEEYYDYLQYLKDNGIPSELIDMFALIYTPCKNKIDIEALESIPFNKTKILTYESFKK